MELENKLQAGAIASLKGARIAVVKVAVVILTQHYVILCFIHRAEIKL
jgi:hypothetical protein